MEPKIYVEGLKVAKIFLKTKWNRISPSIIINYYRAVVIKIMWYLYKDI